MGIEEDEIDIFYTVFKEVDVHGGGKTFCSHFIYFQFLSNPLSFVIKMIVKKLM